MTAASGFSLLQFIRELERPAVIFFLPGFQVSGGVMVALQHARLLQESGWDVTLGSIDEEEDREWYEFEGSRFPVFAAENSRLLTAVDCGVATMWSTCQCLDKWPSLENRAYLVQNYEPDFYVPGDPLRMQARETYGYHPGWKYLTVSPWCADWLREQYGHEAFLVPNGLETAKFYDQQRTMDGKIRILIEGDSTAEHKNVDESFRAAELLEQGKYEIWYMAYHGEPKDWYRVDKFLPQVPYGQVQEVYRQCDILLKSSLLESFSYPPLEMMASGGFVVAVENEGNREYLRDGRTASFIRRESRKRRLRPSAGSAGMCSCGNTFTRKGRGRLKPEMETAAPADTGDLQKTDLRKGRLKCRLFSGQVLRIQTGDAIIKRNVEK